MADRIQHRRDTAERWASINPVLLEGEIGYVLDNPNQHKIGDGVHRWNELPLRGFTGNIAQETGDDENAVMSQKAVTEKIEEVVEEVVKLSELGSYQLNNEFRGKGNEFSSITIKGLVPNHKYRVYIQNDWGINGVTTGGSIFYIGSYCMDKPTDLVIVPVNTEVSSYYDIVIPSDSEYIIIGGRANESEKVMFSIVDVTYIEEVKANLLINNISGKGNLYSSIKIDGLIPNHKYRVYLYEQAWDVEGFPPASFMFGIEAYKNNGISVLASTSVSNGVAEKYYDIVIPDEYNYIVIGGRAKDGKTIRFGIVDITDMLLPIPQTYNNNEKKQMCDNIGAVDHDFLNDKFSNKSVSDAIEYYSREVDAALVGGVVRKQASDVGFIVDSYIIPEGCGYVFVSGRQGDWSIQRNLCAFFDESGNSLSAVTHNKVESVSDYMVQVPSNAYEIKVVGTDYAPTSVKTAIETDRIVDLESRVDHLYDELDVLYPDAKYGELGSNYPEQMIEIEKNLNYSNYGFTKRFHFIHVSDSHGGSFGYADKFLDQSEALFLINTGDMLLDVFSDLASSNTVPIATATSKPCYLILGNHDYTYAPSRQDVFDAFMKPTYEHNGINTDKTYYSVDYADYEVKCIMLDINDGWSDDELPSLGPTPLTWGKMSREQINWFIEQLKDATTRGLHVCLFIHIVPCNVDRNSVIDSFSDYHSLGSLAYNLTFLADVVDAWIEGREYNFSYDGNDYNATFTGKGVFVSWFFGHTHWDECGYMEGHPKQFMCCVCRPVGGYTGFGSYDGDKLGVHWNYYTIDPFMRSLSVYRVGQQSTVYATQRKSFRIIY